MQLNRLEITGKSPAAKIVLLHGFGGEASQWKPLMKALEAEGFSSIAFDLPGHAASLNYPDAGSAKVAAQAVIAALEGEGPKDATFHFVGHSFGGAVIALIALFKRDLVASMTFLAPGGFGPDINAAVLKQFAAVRLRPELMDVIGQFYAPRHIVARSTLDRFSGFRVRGGQTDMMIKISEMITTPEGTQGTLPLAKVAAFGIPSTVIWGDKDRIVPVSQAQNLPDANVHILPGIGHTLYEEAFDVVRDTIIQQANGADK
jgi:pimeloyl-ACP methyl ester carboxylesterase